MAGWERKGTFISREIGGGNSVFFILNLNYSFIFSVGTEVLKQVKLFLGFANYFIWESRIIGADVKIIVQTFP